ncbi:TldD/PmbA family protein [Clostridiaceae bacterium M8S5]|nr:TldD/PmbA family protein [Clostridiaceae bacterium M8S5]
MEILKISSFLSNQKENMNRIVSELSKNFEYVSILGEDTKGTTYDIDKYSVAVNDSFWCQRGFVIRVYNGSNYSEYSFNELGNEPLEHTINRVHNKFNEDFNNLKSNDISISKYELLKEEEIKESFYGEVEIPVDTLSNEEKVNKLIKIKDKALEYSNELVDFKVAYNNTQVSKMFISTKKDLEQTYNWSQAYLVPVLRRGKDTKYDFIAFSGLKGLEILDELENSYKGAIDDTIKLFDAKRVVPGEYEIICAPDVSGLIAHEAFGHGVEMDMFVKNRAKAVEYLEKPVASELLDMHDGAKTANHVSSYLFDDEGTIGTDTVIIKNGILKTGISDVLSALKLNTVPTGNGKRQSYERKAYARMTNTIFKSGKDKLEDMIASVKKGYLLEGMQSGMEDPKNWGIQCILTKGKEIVDGKFTGNIIAPVILTGYVPDLLKSITMISDDMKLYGSGMCGKGYKEFVKTSDGGPYIKAIGRLG